MGFNWRTWAATATAALAGAVAVNMVDPTVHNWADMVKFGFWQKVVALLLTTYPIARGNFRSDRSRTRVDDSGPIELNLFKKGDDVKKLVVILGLLGLTGMGPVHAAEVDGLAGRFIRFYPVSGGASVTGNNDFTGTNTFIDNTTWFIGSTTPSKRGRFEVDGFTAANDLVFTLPGTTAATRTIAVLELAQTFTTDQTYTARVLAKTGTVASPGVGFSADVATGTGFYLANNGQIGVTNVGVASGIMRGGTFMSLLDVALNADFTDSDATFSSTALSVSVVSGRTYSFDVALMLSQSTAADGVKIDFNGGAATVTNFRVSCVLTNDVGTIVTQTAATSTTLAGVINAGATVTTAQHLYRCSGTFVPSSSSTFIVRAACNADTTGTLTIHRGSWLNMRDANPL